MGDPAFVRAWSSVEAGRPAEALERFRQLAKDRPDEPFALHEIGRLLEAAGRKDDARRSYEAALDADARDDRFSPAKAEIVRRAAKREGAALAEFSDLLTQAAGGVVGEREMNDDVHWRPTHDREAALAFLDAELARRATPAAEAAAIRRASAQALEKAEPRGKGDVQMDVGAALNVLAIWSRGEGQAGRVFERGVEYLEPFAAQRGYKLGRLMDSPEALSRGIKADYTRRLREADGLWPLVLEHAGETLRRHGRAAEAAELFGRAMREKDARPWARAGHGLSLCGSGRADEGRRELETARAQLPASAAAELDGWASLCGGGGLADRKNGR
jgi:tetratricopeptide (TPR) repeat protein